MFDYFGHFLVRDDWDPGIFWAEGSLPLSETIWAEQAVRLERSYLPGQADLNFLAGTDWRAYLGANHDPTRPVINLIQHVRHGQPESDVYPFLAERAIRVCVSAEVEDAILSTGRVNGPSFAIPNGIDLDGLPSPDRHRVPGSVYILGNKQPGLATLLAERLRGEGIPVSCHADHSPRQRVLDAMTGAEIAVLLPHETEGFYLPALEAMALGSLVVVPDCVGNRSFCRPDSNCLMPSPEPASLVDAVLTARRLLAGGTAGAMLEKSRETAAAHAIESERAAFYEILDNLDQLW